jgi:hypothetical protein
MKATRITLAGLMGLIVLAALGFAALRNANDLIAAVVWTGTLTLLLISAILAFLEPQKKVWMGIAVFGLGYALFTMNEHDGMRKELLSSRILHELFFWTKMTGSNSQTIEVNRLSVTSSSGAITNPYLIVSSMSPPFAPVGPYDPYSEFFLIGHSLFAIMHGVTGGLLAVWYCHWRDSREKGITSKESKPNNS